MNKLYGAALKFWQLLSTAQNKLGNGVALANTDVFYLLANAAWNAEPASYGELTEWYDIMGLPPAVIISGDTSTETQDALKAAGFTPERSFIFRKPQLAEGDAQVEQVSWTQLGYTGELLAKRYEVPEFAAATGKSLTKAVRSASALSSYLAYRDGPVGTLTTFAASGYLLGTLLVDDSGALESRLIQEADSLGLEPLVLEELPTGTFVKGAKGLERWSIR